MRTFVDTRRQWLLAAALGVLSGFYGPPRQYTLTVKYAF